MDCFIFELAFATIFLAASAAAPFFSAPAPPPPASPSSSSSSSSAAPPSATAAAAAPSSSRRLEPWLRFELQQRAPTLVFAALGLAFVADLILAGDTAFWTDWEHAFPASLQV